MTDRRPIPPAGPHEVLIRTPGGSGAGLSGVRGGYQPTGSPVDLSTISPPQTPTAAHKPQNEAHALRSLGDTPYLAWCLVKCMQQFIALAAKRWPNLV